jgi:hypothetical protein
MTSLILICAFTFRVFRVIRGSYFQNLNKTIHESREYASRPKERRGSQTFLSVTDMTYHSPKQNGRGDRVRSMETIFTCSTSAEM